MVNCPGVASLLSQYMEQVSASYEDRAVKLHSYIQKAFVNSEVQNEHMDTAVMNAATFNGFLNLIGIRGFMACIFRKIFSLL
jgi:hypothetical protein